MNKVYKSAQKISFLLVFSFVMSLMLAPSLSYAIYSEYNSNPGLIGANNGVGSIPTVVTSTASNITLSSATLNGFVDGNYLYTSAWFEWGANSILNNPTKYYYGFGQDNLSIPITGLNPNTTYYFRAVAKNAQGTSYGSTYSFTTGYFNTINNNPVNNNYSGLTAITNPATSIYGNSAKLNSTIYGIKNNPANTWFEWGTTEGLGNTSKVVWTGALPAVNHQSTMYGLSPNTTYYFRTVAENSAGRNNGIILSFTTGSTVNYNTQTNTTINTTTNTVNKNTGPATNNVTTTDTVTPYLEGNVIGAGNFLPGNIVGWLILIVLGLLLVHLIQHLNTDLSKNKSH